MRIISIKFQSPVTNYLWNRKELEKGVPGKECSFSCDPLTDFIK